MVEASPKATVPVLILENGEVIDESLDIMLWALKDLPAYFKDKAQQLDLIERCESEFKPQLDRYKYPDRFDNGDPLQVRERANPFLTSLEARLLQNTYLFGEHPQLADYALMPFIRQFAFVDRAYFTNLPLHRLNHWLEAFLNGPEFKAVMKNRPVWQPGHQTLWVDEPELQTRDQFVAKAQNQQA
jgi:glutathione S-transferase